MAQQLCLSSLLVSCGWKTKDFSVKLILSTILFKYCMIVHLFKDMFLRRCDVFIWRLLNKDIHGWWKNRPDLGMNLPASVYYCYIGTLSILIQAVTCRPQQSYKQKGKLKEIILQFCTLNIHILHIKWGLHHRVAG